MSNYKKAASEFMSELKKGFRFGVDPSEQSWWRAKMAYLARDCMRYEEYAHDKQMVIALITVGAMDSLSAEKLPADILNDRDVAMTFVTKDPWRFDMGTVVPEHYWKDEKFIQEAIRCHPCPDRILDLSSPDVREKVLSDIPTIHVHDDTLMAIMDGKPIFGCSTYDEKTEYAIVADMTGYGKVRFVFKHDYPDSRRAKIMWAARNWRSVRWS